MKIISVNAGCEVATYFLSLKKYIMQLTIDPDYISIELWKNKPPSTFNTILINLLVKRMFKHNKKG